MVCHALGVSQASHRAKAHDMAWRFSIYRGASGQRTAKRSSCRYSGGTGSALGIRLKARIGNRRAPAREAREL